MTLHYKPLVSIIINNFNYARYLNDAIQSALNQTYSPIEVIVVDDGSTDHSKEIIRIYEDQIIPIFKQNGGQASACNAGFNASNGEIIFFLDADDYYYPEAVEKVILAWNPENTAKAHFRLQKINQEGKHIGMVPSKKRRLSDGEAWKEIFKCGNAISPPMSGNVYSRNVLLQVMPAPDDDSIGIESYLLKRVPFFGNYVNVDEPLGVYRIHNQNAYARVNIYERYDIISRQIDRAEEVFPFYQHEANKRNIKIDKNLLYRNVNLLRLRILSYRIAPDKHQIKGDSLNKLFTLSLQNCIFHKRYGFARRMYELLITIWVFIRPIDKVKKSFQKEKVYS
jgi:glycosyltransferase involved in cell wall biosynthesis